MAPPGEAPVLERLLRRVAQGRTDTISGLAQELGVSEELVNRMVQDLVRLGYLRSARADGAQACAACSLTGCCGHTGTPRLWLLTERGKRAAGKAP